MNEHKIPDPPINFKPDYKWPEPESEKACPRCGQPLQLIEQQPNYLGKPWWCGTCRWQFTEADLARH